MPKRGLLDPVLDLLDAPLLKACCELSAPSLAKVLCASSMPKRGLLDPVLDPVLDLLDAPLLEAWCKLSALSLAKVLCALSMPKRGLLDPVLDLLELEAPLGATIYFKPFNSFQSPMHFFTQFQVGKSSVSANE